VCAPEVKKKFRKREAKKGRTRKIYFGVEACNDRTLPAAGKQLPMKLSRRRRAGIFARPKIQKLPAGCRSTEPFVHERSA
jgi:hypothetical protein